MKEATRAYKIGAGINTGAKAVGSFFAAIGYVVKDVAVGSVKGMPAATTPQRRIARKARR